MKPQYGHLGQAMSAVGILSLAAGLFVARFSGNLLASGATTFLVIVLSAVLLRRFFASWARERNLENPAYGSVISQHFANLRLAAFSMPALALLLAWFAYAENEMTAAVGAGTAAGLPILWLAMKSAFEVEAVKP